MLKVKPFRKLSVKLWCMAEKANLAALDYSNLVTIDENDSIADFDNLFCANVNLAYPPGWFPESPDHDEENEYCYNACSDADCGL